MRSWPFRSVFLNRWGNTTHFEELIIWSSPQPVRAGTPASDCPYPGMLSCQELRSCQESGARNRFTCDDSRIEPKYGLLLLLYEKGKFITRPPEDTIYEVMSFGDPNRGLIPSDDSVDDSVSNSATPTHHLLYHSE